MSNENKQYEKRYLLFGTAGAWQDYIFESDDVDEIRMEAYYRLKMGYTASILDRETDEQTDLSLKDHER